MVNFLSKIFGDENSKKIKEILPLVNKVNSFKTELESLSDADLRHKTAEFKERLSKGESLDDILPEAFATVREAAKRVINQFHFDVQLIGGIVMHRGGIAEMRTGEGKTLVATLPVYLNALTGKGVHVVTVNDYLSRRDAIWMGQIYDFLGLSIAVVNHEASFVYDSNINNEEQKDKERDAQGAYKVLEEFLRPVTRHEAYMADITYGTNNEFGFDYLRDNLEYQKEKLRQRDFNFVVIDEVDSILIDEARTPLIISAPSNDSDDLYKVFAKISRNLKAGVDYEIDEKLKAISLNDVGIEKAEQFLGVGNIYTDKGIKYVHHLETAVRADAIFKRDKDYVVKDGEVIIVDEFTGRLQPGRRWSEGLHQAIEAKEGVEIQKESKTFASITYQNYFRMYKKLSGMTGTAMTNAEEFYKVYGLDTVSIPTNKPVVRQDKDDLIFQNEKGKFMALVREIKEINKTGQPILIGTVSIEKNEILSEYLNREGVKHIMLNAKNHEREGEIVAQAGRIGAVTLATNMAGRGVDIKLGGNPGSKDDYEKVKSLGGLYVLGTERHDARRIDNQLRGRSGRQGDPGATQFFVSMEDTLLRVFAAGLMKKMMGKLGLKEDEPVTLSIITRSLETAQTKIEGFHFDSRKHVLEFDDVLNFQRQIVYERRRVVLTGDDDSIISHFYEFIADDEKAVQEAKDKEQKLGKEKFVNGIRQIMLQINDLLWVEHLEIMDHTRGSVNLRAYGQRDPLIEYKKEGKRLFGEMEVAYKNELVRMVSLFNADIKQAESQSNLQEVHKQAGIISSGSDNKVVSQSGIEKVGRNDLCPCGSGKKYKKCHGVNS